MFRLRTSTKRYRRRHCKAVVRCKISPRGASDSVGVGNLPPDEEQESVRHIPDDLNGDATSSEALNASWNESSEGEEQGDSAEAGNDGPYDLEGFTDGRNDGDAPAVERRPPLQSSPEMQAPALDNGPSDKGQPSTSCRPEILGHSKSSHSEIADELHEHRKRAREEMGDAEGFFGEEGDADARMKKRRRTEQNMEQPIIQSKPRPARLRRQQDIRTAQEIPTAAAPWGSARSTSCGRYCQCQR